MTDPARLAVAQWISNDPHHAEQRLRIRLAWPELAKALDQLSHPSRGLNQLVDKDHDD